MSVGVLNLLTVALVCAAYQPVWHAGFIWDDPEYIVNNVNLRSFAGLVEMWVNPRAGTHQYYPLTLSSFWLEYQLWGDNPLGYHVVNLALQVANAILLRKLLTQLKVPAALFISLGFAIHPVQVETVAWATERKNLLSALFYLLAFITWTKTESWEREPPNRRTILSTTVLHLCGLLSKTVTATLPAAILLVTWWRKGTLKWRDAKRLAPMFGLSVVMGMITSLVERNIVGAQGSTFDLSMGERILLASRVVVFYVSKLFAPIDLSFNYPRWNVHEHGGFFVSLVVVIALTIVLACVAKHNRGPLTSWLGYVGTLVPALGFVNVYPFRFSYVADHFQYLAVPWLIAGVAAGASQVKAPERIKGLGGTAVIVVWGAISWMQTHVYKNTITLWTDAIEKNPGSYIGHVNLAQAYAANGDYETAEPLLRKAVTLEPTDPSAHRNLGIALGKQGRWADAVPKLEEALRLSNGETGDAFALAVACAETGQKERAVGLLEEILKAAPEDARARAMLERLKERAP